MAGWPKSFFIRNPPRGRPAIEPTGYHRVLSLHSPGRHGPLPRTRTFFRRLLPASLLPLGLFLLVSCRTAPVPVNDQSILDRARISLPDTYPSRQTGRPEIPRHPYTEAALHSMGFEWNDPRFVSGRRLSRGDEVAWFDREGQLHVTRYTGVFHESGYRIRRYVPSSSGDLEHRGSLVSRSLTECLYDRPGAAVHYHHNLSGVTLFIETLGGGGIDTLILPVTLPLCILSDRLSPSFSHARSEEDDSAARQARRLAAKLRQKGKPIPTKVTAPASVE
ncbi:MAG: hypothetical protein ACP5OP_04515 [Leptospirillia bacterium]